MNILDVPSQLFAGESERTQGLSHSIGVQLSQAMQ